MYQLSTLPYDIAARRSRAAEEIRGKSGAEILASISDENARKATMLITEGSVRLITGHYATQQDIEKMKSELSKYADGPR